jgi:hypothetical protein
MLKHNGLAYFQTGNLPRLLIHSGTHGDEYGVIEPVKRVVKKYQKKLPEYLLVPEVSKSAVGLKTRKNRYGRDLNRHFSRRSKDPEIRANIELLYGRSFELCLNFHEDLDHKDLFYLYDTHRMSRKSKVRLNRSLEKIGIGRFSGIDDPEDPELGNRIREGYRDDGAKKDHYDSGMLSAFGIRSELIKRTLTIEVPGKAPMATKTLIVEVVIEGLLSHRFN